MDVTDAARVFNVVFDTERASETATCDMELKFRQGSQHSYSTMGKYNGVKLYKTNTIAKLKQAGEYLLVVKACSEPRSLPAPTQIAFTVTARKGRSMADPLLIGSFQFSANKETESIQSVFVVFSVLLLSILFVFCIGQGASWSRKRRLPRPQLREPEAPVENVITEVLGLEKLPENDGEWRELFNSICESSPDGEASEEPSPDSTPSPMGWLNDYWHCSDKKESFGGLGGRKLSPTQDDDSGDEDDLFAGTSKKTQ